MQYINVQNYNKETIKFTLAFVLAVLWAVNSFIFISKINLFQSIPLAFSSDLSISYLPKGEGVKVGPETQKLIGQITEKGLSPFAVANIKREFFSPEGRLITLEKDNIAVFEYKDFSLISSEINNFKESANTKRGSWKKNVHLYNNEKLIVFYLGEKESIKSSLEGIFGKSVSL